jgi:hypothetical protein
MYTMQSGQVFGLWGFSVCIASPHLLYFGMWICEYMRLDQEACDGNPDPDPSFPSPATRHKVSAHKGQW